ncbi:hypothetical protein Goshw_021884 [Gossypium schwendimanii]|uniref:Uncharacterized protein n=1 Tax=Gossypium schwendimanii TaxID=34291 RepID=A0A7J9NDE7_GOSSC|nr:hypothetical protein [Gossypium schwendimanii]
MEIPSGDRVKAEDDLPYSDEGFSPDSTKQIHQTVKEDVKDKSNKNQCVEVENLKGNSELEGSTNLIGAQQLGHKKRSWHRLVNRDILDTNMSETIMGKRKFNQEESDDIEPYSSVEDIAKRIKFDSGYSKVLIIIEPSWPISKEDLDSLQIISATAKWQADRK